MGSEFKSEGKGDRKKLIEEFKSEGKDDLEKLVSEIKSKGKEISMDKKDLQALVSQVNATFQYNLQQALVEVYLNDKDDMESIEEEIYEDDKEDVDHVVNEAYDASVTNLQKLEDEVESKGKEAASSGRGTQSQSTELFAETFHNVLSFPAVALIGYLAGNAVTIAVLRLRRSAFTAFKEPLLA